MKTTVILFLAFLAVLLPLTLSSAQFGPLWKGPRTTVQWNGFRAITTNIQTNKAIDTLPGTAVQDQTPRWVGYNKRGSEWWFRVILCNQQSEMIHRGGSTSDGWQLIHFHAQANKPYSITLSKNGVERTLKLSPQ